MKKNIPIIPLVLSLLLGLVAFFAILKYLNQIKLQNKRAVEKELRIKSLPAFNLVLAKRAISVAEPLTKDKLMTISLKSEPENKPKNVFYSVDALRGQYAASDIPAGNIIQQSQVTAEANELRTIQDLIPVGMRAISLEVTNTVLDFINPGDKVDLLAELTRGGSEKYSKIILQNVLVLAKGNLTQAGKRAISQPSKNNLLTFALTVKQSEALSAVGANQKIRVILRSSKDSKFVETTGESMDYFFTESPKSGKVVKKRGMFIY